MNTAERIKRVISRAEPADELARELDEFKVTIKVVDAAGYQAAVLARGRAKASLKKVEAKFTPMIAAAAASLAQIRASQREWEQPAKNFIQMVDVELAAFELAEEDRRKREEIKLAQAQVKIDADRRKLEVEHLKKTGYVSDAKELAVQPLPPPILPVVPSAVPKVAGFTTRTLREAKVTDLMALVKAVAEGKAALECLDPNMPVLNALARAATSTLSIPGVEVVEKPSRSQRS